MKSADFDLSGFEGALKNFAKKMDDNFPRGLFLAAEHVKGISVNRVPFDRGFSGGLASTASVSTPRRESNQWIVELGYNKVYAVKLHEDLSLKIRQTNTVGGQSRGAKYLEGPLKESGDEISKIISTFLQFAK